MVLTTLYKDVQKESMIVRTSAFSIDNESLSLFIRIAI